MAVTDEFMSNELSNRYSCSYRRRSGFWVGGIKTHGSVSCGPRSRRVTPVSILTGRKKTQFSHLRSSVIP